MPVENKNWKPAVASGVCRSPWKHCTPTMPRYYSMSGFHRPGHPSLPPNTGTAERKCPYAHTHNNETKICYRCKATENYLTPRVGAMGYVGKVSINRCSVRRISRYPISHLILAFFGSRRRYHALLLLFLALLFLFVPFNRLLAAVLLFFLVARK